MTSQSKAEQLTHAAAALVTGGFKGGELIAVDPDFRIVSLEEIHSSLLQSAHLWVVMHGWNSSLESFRKLAQAIAQVRPQDRILLLDWRQISMNGNFWNGGNYRVASWVIPVAEKIEQMLRLKWQVSDQYAHHKLHLVGHSLGAIMAAELAARFSQGVKTIFALDPASEWHLRPFENSTGYDLDGRTPERERPREFRTVSQYSYAFVGKRSAAGNQRLANTAHASFQLDFGCLSVSQHQWVHEIFRRFIVPKKIGSAEHCFSHCYSDLKLSLTQHQLYHYPRSVTCSMRPTELF